MFGEKFEKQKFGKVTSRNWYKLVVEIDTTLSFDEYISSLCWKAGKKLSALARLSNFTCTNKKRVLMKVFIESQFGCCPLI